MCDEIIELNVGGSFYTTSVQTLFSSPNCFFSTSYNFETKTFNLPLDANGRCFIDRDGKIFQYILEFLRNKTVVLPDRFDEKRRLKSEAEFYKLPLMIKLIDDHDLIDGRGSFVHDSIKNSLRFESSDKLSNMSLQESKRNHITGCIIIGYRGTFANGRDGLVDVKFRKISRILVCGRVGLCRAVFGETLNESRDPDHSVSERYTSRYYLKHTFLEQAIDSLIQVGFKLICSAATGANSGTNICGDKDILNKQHLMNTDNEENKWLHYNEYVFYRD